MLNGFKQYISGDHQYATRESGLAELRRLEKGHFLVAVPADHETAYRYISGTDGLRHVSSEMVVDAETIDQMAKTARESILVIPIPKRWFSRPQLETKGVSRSIGEFIPLGDGWKLPVNYVWGYFSKWNEDREETEEPGRFYRNPHYHANDALYEKWKRLYHKEAPRPQPLDRPTPSTVAPYQPHGYRTFHGYNPIEFDAPQ